MATEHDSVDLVSADVTLGFARAVLFAALLAVGAWIAIPISAVPGTLQTFVVFLVGLYLGPYWGTASVVLYLAVGAVGAPVFAEFSAGFGVLLGPHGGFLWTFPVAAFLIGAAVHRGGDLRNPADASLPVLVGSLLAATAVVYAAGFGWYAWSTGTPLGRAFALVAAPLLPGDLLKVAAAVAVVRTGAVDPT
ncbi:biotin transporter BioY [Salinilacihabitans rarus]|uniref:biotin transporter BioY n=1 Tax=Salinilacihabitans rarus TaxID=2961596 RepID=UPI0020C85F0C|nr:biotin transporter BioY [Salinilacihabitans rarus]